MARFAVDTRRWLEAAIKQRRLLIRLGKSHKPAADLHTVENLLNTYSYSNDLYMARFICQYKCEIENILPGAGSSSCRKRQMEFNDICYAAVMIISGNLEKRPPLCETPNSNSYGNLF
jgi:hypothetical protein